MQTKNSFQDKAVWTLAVLILSLTCPAIAQGGPQAEDQGSGEESKVLSAYEGTPLPVVEKMLELAQVRPNDVVYDIGSGDGRVLIMAARKFGARGVGIELDSHYFEESQARIWDLGLRDRIQLVHGDVLDQDLSLADVVTIYMTPYALWKLRPHLEKFLHQGMRIVTVVDQVPGWKPAATVTAQGDNQRSYRLSLYVVTRPGQWTSFSKFGRTQ
jgi:protein-L-isoaspartate O-methyltransferase